MRKLLSFMFLLVGLLLTGTAIYAQDRPITGRVTEEGNKPLSGVTVRVKGTQKTSVTNANGGFTIQAKAGDVLQFSFVGRSSSELTVGSNDVVEVQMSAKDDVMSEVVVTAMDIRRSAREVPYSVQKVSGAEIQETQRENFINSLQGRVAGLTINQTSGMAGASSSIVLRGFNSLSMSNQPLFVIDGIIVDNSTVDENSGGGAGVGMVERTGLTSTSNRNTDYTNRIADINPNDIESVTILKGPEATALYGSQASSGAIVITTRKAKSTKLAVQYDNSFRLQKVTRFPEVFDAYGTGTNGDTSSVFRYFGPAYTPGTQLYNNQDNLFKTGFAQTHNVGADFGFKNSMFRFSGSFFDQNGIIPFNNYKRYNLRLSNTTRFGSILDITPSVTYIKTQNNKVLRSAGGFMISLLSWPSTLDIKDAGDNATKSPLFGTSASPNAELDNPLFNVRNNKSYDETDRINTSLGINLNPFNWLSLAGRFGYETYSTDGYLRYHPLSYYISVGTGGLQDNWYRRYNGYNHTITATARKTLGKDFNFRLLGGTMWQDYQTKMFAVSGTNIVDSIVRGVMYKAGQVVTSANYDQLLGSPADSTVTRPNTRQRLLRNMFGDFNEQILRQFAYFGEFSFNYKNVVFLSYSHRFEQASTLPKKNRNYNYPGGGISIIVSELLPGIKDQDVINYFKLRGSIARTARLNSPYSTQSVFVNHLASGGGFSYGFTNNNPDLEPEMQRTFEFGMEWRLLKNKVNLEATYYNTLNKGQIIEGFRLSYGTGYVLNSQNAGSTRNQGIEISLDVTPVRTTNFSYNSRFNFNHMWNKVVGLPKNVAEYYLADTWLYGNARAGLSIGGPTTTITGYGYLRNNNGDILISPTTGLPVIDATFKIRGDRNPDFTLGWNNSFTYKNFRFNFLWDFKVGGDIYNGTQQYLTTIGRSTLTADRMTPRVIAGVLQDGLENTATPTPNNISVTPYYNEQYYRALPEEAFIERNVNWARLRDLTLSYTFPQSFAGKIRGVKNLGVFFTANDLILISNYSGADPGVNGNTAGGRGVGAFGFDYGTLPAPISLNFGLRASF
ncbi:MAG TPA: SusC/RagA family TonB-linked outer membrane protein [Flavisolibacter sp.]|nr:SusC/RagA family TonB-linked outer membrane protein [Flavisolibacter sp.]